LGNDESLPSFVKKEIPNYSEDFDSSSIDSSCEIDLPINSPRTSGSFLQIPKMKPEVTQSGRKKWKIDGSIPFKNNDDSSTLAMTQHSKTESELSESPMTSPEPEMVQIEPELEPPAEQLRKLNFDRKSKNWLQESWNLISDFEKNKITNNRQPDITHIRQPIEKVLFK